MSPLAKLVWFRECRAFAALRDLGTDGRRPPAAAV
jgi:hypothetical protein